jgi:uncharacterized protein (TIGR02001 family)
MKKHATSRSALTLVGLVSVVTGVSAQTVTPNEPASSLAYNVGVVSEYRYRGIAQSRFQPALQGGVDYSDKSGLYVGAWASQIKWISDNSESGPDGTKVKGDIELDLYGGYKFALGDVAMDVGLLRYEYLGNTLANRAGAFKNPNTNEVYVAATLGRFTAKYSYALTDLFGQYDFANVRSSMGSGYLDLNAAFDLGHGFSLVPQVGHQTVKNVANASYTHASLSLNKDLGQGTVLTATFHESNAKSSGGYIVGDSGGSQAGKNTGSTALVLGLKYTF